MKKIKHNFYVTPTLVDSFLWYERFGCPQDKFEEIINKINKVPIEYPEAAKKGVVFEDCVNLTMSGQPIFKKDGFEFDESLVRKVAKKLSQSIGQQVWIEKTVPFEYGNVRVGGFVDYDYTDKIIDLKTTGNYKLGKYKEYQQHRAYGLIKPEKTDFIYFVTDFENTYIEPYKNKKSNHEEFLNNVSKFWEFTQENEHLITDLKIFNKKNK